MFTLFQAFLLFKSKMGVLIAWTNFKFVIMIFQQVQNFGEPFFLVIHEGETLAEVSVRIQKKLQVPDEEFAKVLTFGCLEACNYLYGIIRIWYCFISLPWLRIQLRTDSSSLLLCVLNPFGCSVEVCIFVNGSSRVPAGLWCCIQPFSGVYMFTYKQEGMNSSAILLIGGVLAFCIEIEYFDEKWMFWLVFLREEMFMAPGSSTLDWNTLIIPQRGLMQ